MRQVNKNLDDVTEKEMEQLGNEGAHLKNHIDKCERKKGCRRWEIVLMYEDVDILTADWKKVFEVFRFKGTDNELVLFLQEKCKKGYYIGEIEEDLEVPFE